MPDPLLANSATLQTVVSDGTICRLVGDWNVQQLSAPGAVLARRQALAQVKSAVRWDLSGIRKLDAVGAQLLWQAWGQCIPPGTVLTPSQQALLGVLAQHPIAAAPAPQAVQWYGWIITIGQSGYVAVNHGRELLLLLGGLVFNLGLLLARPSRGPWREISAQIFRVGAQALGITALVGFLIGVVLSYLSAQQLAVFGAGQFIVKLLGGCHGARAWPGARRHLSGGAVGLIHYCANWRHASDPRA